MDETYLLQALSMLFFSAWKTYIGPAVAAASNFTYWEMLLFNMGAALSSAAATLAATDFWMARRNTKAKGFNKNLRKALRFWRRFGKRFTLLLSPILLGVPSYALLARRLKETKSRIMLELSLSTFFWCSLVYWASLEGLLLVENLNLFS
jgi:uncharacterized membrane protein YhaH (DUF805 family)